MSDVSQLLNRAEAEIRAAQDLHALDHVRTRWLGRKGELTVLLKQLGTLPAAERPAVGETINQAK